MLEVGGVCLNKSGGVRVGVRSGRQLRGGRSLNPGIGGVVVDVVVVAAIAGG